jgi:hypothetical protein
MERASVRTLLYNAGAESDCNGWAAGRRADSMTYV